jgi:hypothetical protein
MKNHKEAFSHMTYTTRDLQNQISVWNSRDGVTPFVIFVGGLEYHHTNWNGDREDPNYQLKVGDHIFVTINKEMATKIAEERHEYLWNERGEKSDKEKRNELHRMLEDKEGFVNDLVDQLMGQPYYVFVTEESFDHWAQYVKSEDNHMLYI